MQKLLKTIKEMFAGRYVEESVDLLPTVATVYTDNNSYKITRDGAVINDGLGVFLVTGKDSIKDYLKGAKNFIEDDLGVLIAISQVRRVELAVSSKTHNISYKV